MNVPCVLIQVDSPFIVCMTYAFQTHDKLLLVLDLMNGGDLQYHLQNRDRRRSVFIPGLGVMCFHPCTVILSHSVVVVLLAISQGYGALLSGLTIEF